MEFFLAPLVIVGAVAAGSILISRSVLTAPDLIVFLMYIGYLTSPLTKMAQWVGQFQDAIAGFDRFTELLEMKPENTARSGEETPRFSGKLEFIDASFKYGEKLENVIENISFKINPGESAALIGTSGAGKTTLCSLIPRFYELTSGIITIDGINIKEMDLGVLRRNIGVVAQDVYLFNGKVSENIRYGKPDASEDEIVNAAKLAKAHDFIMELPDGYETEIGQRGIRLSGGQRQRLSIARVFLKDPPILIFDEATSALDYENERSVMDSLGRLAQGRTTFIIAHRLSTIRNADRIVVLTDDGIAEQGTHEELYRMGGVYAGLYNAQE
jgi:ATP-binding cassette subfamily B protein